MAPPPTQVTYRPSFEPFTTDREAQVGQLTVEYMFPESESHNLSDLERFQVDNFVFDVSLDTADADEEDIKIAEGMLNHSHTPSSQRWWFSEFFPRIAYEWCFWYDRSVTSEEVDVRMDRLTTNMLYQFHFNIVDQTHRSRYSVLDLLESVRAIRDRMHPDTREMRWQDEWP